MTDISCENGPGYKVIEHAKVMKNEMVVLVKCFLLKDTYPFVQYKLFF